MSPRWLFALLLIAGIVAGSTLPAAAAPPSAQPPSRAAALRPDRPPSGKQPDESAPPTQALSLSLARRLAWYAPPSGTSSFDIVMIEDRSYSMRWCWTTMNACSASRGDRRIDYASDALRRFVNELLVTQAGAGADHRLAYVTFGHLDGGKSIAKLRVPFGDNHASTLSQFAALIGTIAQPRSIDQDTELTGNTNPADGFEMALGLFAKSPRFVDAHGNQVRRAIVYLTDGVPDVLFDYPYRGFANQPNVPPFNCNGQGVNDPIFQFNCPPVSTQARNGGVRSPIRAALSQAERAHDQNIPIYGILIGDTGVSDRDIYLDEMAPGRTGWAHTGDALWPLVQGVIGGLGDPCQSHQFAAGTAAGAAVTVRGPGGTVAAAGITGANSRLDLQLPPGAYTLEAFQPNVVAPEDPLHIARNYGRLAPIFGGHPSATLAFTVTDAPVLIDARFSLADPATAACP